MSRNWIALLATMAVLSPIAAAVTITNSPSLPPAMVGVLFSQTLVAANGTAPYIFRLTSTTAPNVLPAGLNLGTNGVLSGTPTVSGSFQFLITVTDQAKAQSTTQFSVTIAPALVITTASPLPPATVNASYSQAIAVTGGTPPYAYSTTGSVPPGLKLAAGVLSGIPTSAGGYAFGAVVTDKNSFSTFKQYQITVTPATTLLQVSPLKLSFAALAGGDDAPPQTLAIVPAGGAQVNYSISIDGGSAGTAAPSWLSVKPLIGSAPAAITVIASPGTMSAGTYPATIHVSVSNSTAQPPTDVAVAFTITAGSPVLEVIPTSLKFGARALTAGKQDQVIAVRNPGGGGPLDFSASVVGGSPWIVSVTPTTGRATPNAPALVHVIVDSQGLSAGSFHDILRITTSAGNFDAAIELFVSSQGPIIGLTSRGVRFSVRQGSGSTRPEAISVLNLGDLSSPLNPTVDILSGSDWLKVSQTGAAPASLVASTLTLSTTGDANTLPAGGAYAMVRVSDPNAVNSPQYLTAVLDLQPTATPAAPDPSPVGLFFTPTSGAQNVAVYVSSSTALAFQASSSTSDGAAWLSLSPSSGTASTQSPANLSVKIASTGLAPGVYTGSVNISMGAALRSVNVTLVIPRSAGSARPGSLVALASGCTPAGLAIAQTGIVNNFSVPAGWPAALIVQLNDDCGNAVSNGSVIANFSNSDPPLTLHGDGTSNVYSATWQPSSAAASTTVTLRAAAGAFPPAVAQFQGGVNANASATPTLVPDGALHIFFDVPTSIALGRGLAPGNVAQVYGTGMASVSQSPGVIPLVSEFSGTLMLIGSTEAPLFFVSDGLLDVQVPFELVPNRQYSAIVSANGALSLPETLTVVPFQPGMAAFADGTVIAQHVLDNFSLVTAAHPAKPGEPIVIYLSGMGGTNPAVPSGQQTPSQLVPASTQPTITVDGQRADIGYAGLTPSGIGLYQLNFTVPPNAKAGNLEIIVTQSGVRANTTTLPVSN